MLRRVVKIGMRMKTEPTYLTGEPIREGDLIRVGEWEGVVEAIVTKASDGWADFWHAIGEGVMLIGPAFGRLYTSFHDAELSFAGRKQKGKSEE